MSKSKQSLPPPKGFMSKGIKYHITVAKIYARTAILPAILVPLPPKLASSKFEYQESSLGKVFFETKFVPTCHQKILQVSGLIKSLKKIFFEKSDVWQLSSANFRGRWIQAFLKEKSTETFCFRKCPRGTFLVAIKKISSRNVLKEFDDLPSNKLFRNA